MRGSLIVQWLMILIVGALAIYIFINAEYLKDNSCKICEKDNNYSCMPKIGGYLYELNGTFDKILGSYSNESKDNYNIISS